MIGMRARRYACLVATALVAALAYPVAAAAEPVEEGAVVSTPLPSPQGPWGHLTQEEIEKAEPLPIVTLPGSPPAAEESPVTTFEEPEPTPSRTAAVGAQTAALEGIEITAAESTAFPNDVNGKLIAVFQWREGGATKNKTVSCSASVVSSPRDNLIVTAGHCAIDPDTAGAAINSETIFIPGFRNGEKPPFGKFRVNTYAIPKAWETSAVPGSRPNEGADVAFMELRDNERGESVEEAVGLSMGIAFDQPCNQLYTQYGYPAEYPYSGEFLYSHVAPFAGADTAAGFTPVPMKIASDFTRGSSGGPWVAGPITAPTVLSVTAYGYAEQPGYLYGPYFGEAAKKAYAAITSSVIPAGIEESCTALPIIPPPTPTTTPPTQTVPPAPTPEPETTPPPVTLRVTQVRTRADGSAVLTANVSTAGILKLSGTAVRGKSLDTPAGGKYRLVVATRGATNRALRHAGKVKVGVSVAFSASGKTKRVSKKIALSRPAVARAAQQRAARSH